MIFTSSENWYSWSYNGNKFSRSKSKDDIFSTEFNSKVKNVKTFKDELLAAARNILDHYSGLKPCIMFSGGVDSELVLRAFIDIGIKPEVFIFKYENNYNIYDVTYATTICSILNVNYKIIDFNLKNFYENQAESIADQAQIDRAITLPQLKFMDYVDDLPIYAASDPSWTRLSDDYSIKNQWVMRCWEHDIGWSKYIVHNNRPAVMEFFKWTPELLLSWNETAWLKKLVNDFYHGKLGTNSTKIIGYREVYSDLIERQKKTGFEKCDSLINEFQNFIEVKNNGLHFRRYFDRTYDQLLSDLCLNRIGVLSNFER